MPLRMHQLSGKLAASFSGQIGVFLFSFASQAIIARSLGPEGKGAFSLVVLITNIVFVFIHGSLGSANAHFIGRYPGSGAGIFGNSLITGAALGGAFTAIFLTFADPLIGRFFTDIDPALVRLTILCLPFLLLIEYNNNIVMGLERIGRFSLLLMSREALFSAALLMLILLGTVSVKSFLSAWALVVVIMAFAAVYNAWSGLAYRARIDLKLWIKTLRFSAQWHAAILSSFLRLRFDWLVVAHYMDTAALGYYTTATGIATLLWYLPGSVAQVLLPYISWRDNSAGNRLTPRLSRLNMLIIFTTGVGMAAFGWLGIRIIFGAAFLPAYVPLLILLPGAIFYSMARLLAGDLGGRGLPYYSVIISVTTLAVNVFAAIMLVPRYGIVGAAVASTLSHILTGAMFLKAFQRESGATTRETLVVEKQDIKDLMKVLKLGREK